MLAAWSYEEICYQLSFAFNNRYESDPENYVRMVGILFAHPDAPLFRDEILKKLDYFHQRSGNHIDFFCAGYGAYWGKNGYPDQRVVARIVQDDDYYKRETQWLFSAQAFNQLRKEIESMTKWKYSGDVDLILTNARYAKNCDDSRKIPVYLDFSSSIMVDLRKALDDKAIETIGSFFEKIFQYSEKQTGRDPTWGFGIEKELKVAGSAFTNMILSLLPIEIRKQDIQKLKHFWVANINK